MKLEDPKPAIIRDTQAVRKALAEIKSNNAESLLVPAEVVESARSPKSPLHNYFKWDDAEAAAQYRLMQARALIREIEVVFPDDPQENAVPKYVSLARDRKRSGGGYRETGQVLSNKELLAELEETAKKELASWTERYRMLHGLVNRVRKAAGIKAKAASASN